MPLFDKDRRAARRDYARDLWETYQTGRTQRVQARQGERTARVQSRQWGRTDRKALKQSSGMASLGSMAGAAGFDLGSFSDPRQQSGSIMDSVYFWPVLGIGAFLLLRRRKK